MTKKTTIRKVLYKVEILIGEENIEVDTYGVKDGESFVKFMELIAPTIPRFLVDFVEEHVVAEHQPNLLIDFLLGFIRTYLDLTGLDIPNFMRFVAMDREEGSTVH